MVLPFAHIDYGGFRGGGAGKWCYVPSTLRPRPMHIAQSWSGAFSGALHKTGDASLMHVLSANNTLPLSAVSLPAAAPTLQAKKRHRRGWNLFFRSFIAHWATL